MSNAQPEPSMEEILASIRRIISEDEEIPAEAAAEPAPVRESAVVDIETANEVFRTAPAAHSDFDVPDSEEDAVETVLSDDESFDADSIVDEIADEEDGAGDHLETEDVAMIKDAVMSTVEEEGAMLGEATASAASKAFQSLSQTVKVSNGDGRTLEDIATEIMKPLVKEWLDENLPGIVEEKVEREVQRLARNGR